MTPEDYYKRKVVADFIEEEMRSARGCRTFLIIMAILLGMAVGAAIWL